MGRFHSRHSFSVMNNRNGGTSRALASFTSVPDRKPCCPFSSRETCACEMPTFLPRAAARDPQFGSEHPYCGAHILGLDHVAPLSSSTRILADESFAVKLESHACACTGVACVPLPSPERQVPRGSDRTWLCHSGEIQSLPRRQREAGVLTPPDGPATIGSYRWRSAWPPARRG